MASSQFADTAQIPRPTLSQIMSGRNKKISNEIIGKLHEAFPQLNVIWLLFGDGQMLTDAQKPASEPQIGANLFDSVDETAYDQPFSTADGAFSDHRFSQPENQPSSPQHYAAMPHRQPTPPPQVKSEAYHPASDYQQPAPPRSERPIPSQPTPRQQGQQSPTAQQSMPRQAMQPSAYLQPTTGPAANPASVATAIDAADKTKRIASIMVFYTDQSFETFYPSEPRE